MVRVGWSLSGVGGLGSEGFKNKIFLSISDGGDIAAIKEKSDHEVFRHLGVKVLENLGKFCFAKFWRGSEPCEELSELGLTKQQ